MKRKIYLFFSMLCWMTVATAQIDGYLHALNATGTTGSDGGNTYSYSVGETVAFASSCDYTAGIIQPKYECISISNEAFDLLFSASFYPNPASSQIIVETDFLKLTDYTIHASDGQLMESGQFEYKPIKIHRLAPGTYLLKLTDNDNQFFKTVKIIKQ